MQSYIDIINEVMDNGTVKTDRTGTGTISKFVVNFRHDMQKGFPLVTIKKTHLRSIIHELLWFFKGDTNVKYLQDNGVSIWDEWAAVEEKGKAQVGDLGPVYGKQWRDFNGVDQIDELIKTLRTDPDSRRMVVSAWNPEVLPARGLPPHDQASIGKQALPPCHLMFILNVSTRSDGKRYLNLFWLQRSADVALGVPFNIASYAMILEIFAAKAGLEVGELAATFVDCHIYLNHIEGIQLIRHREPKPLPMFLFDTNMDNIVNTPIEQLKPEWFKVSGYDPHPGVKFPIAV